MSDGDRVRDTRAASVLVAFAAPLLLAALPAWMIGRATAEWRAARTLVQAEIRRIDAALGPLTAFQRQRTTALARNAVLRELDVNRPRVVHLLSMLGTLPATVTLERASMKGRGLVLAGTAHAPGAIPDAIAALEAAGAIVAQPVAGADAQVGSFDLHATYDGTRPPREPVDGTGATGADPPTEPQP